MALRSILGLSVQSSPLRGHSPVSEAPYLLVQDVPTAYGRADALLGRVPEGSRCLDRNRGSAYHLPLVRRLQPRVLFRLREHARGDRRQAGGCASARSLR